MKCKYCNSDLLENSTICPNCKKDNNEVMSDFADLKEKKGGVKYFCLLLIILLLGVIGFGYYYVTKPDVVFTTLLNKVYKEALKESNFEQLKMTTNMNIKIEASEEYKEYTDIINNINFRMNEHIDLTDNTFKLEIGADYKEKLLANINAYYKDNTMYFEIKDILDKIIKVDLKKENQENEQDIDINKLYSNDSKVIINKLYEALKETLKNGTYVSNDAKVNGNTVSKNELVINNRNKDILINTFVYYLLNDNDFIDSVSRVFSKDKQEIINSLNELKDTNELEKEIHISIYTKKLTNEFVKLEVVIEENTLLSLTMEKEDACKIEVNNGDNIKMVSTIVIDESNNNMKIVTESNTDDIKVMVNMDISIIYNEKIEKTNVENAITIEELSEEDTNNIIENLTKNEGISEIMKTFEEIMQNQELMTEEETNMEEYK